MTRRQMLSLSVAALAPAARAAAATKMTLQLDCGSLGIKATQEQAFDYARRFGFAAVTPDSSWLTARSADEVKRFVELMRSSGVAWGCAGFGLDFRSSEENFAAGLKTLPATAAALQRAGVTRTSTWISPSSKDTTYWTNFRLHSTRLRQCAVVLGDYGVRLGLEYVGPKTAWTGSRYAFIHSMKELRELIGEIQRPNVGLLVDSWHWFTAGESVADLATLTNNDIVSIDLNDAPAGVPLDQQKDSVRELPGATGVIPLTDFLAALNRIGCDAPVRCEPFNAALRAMEPEMALKTTIEALKNAFSALK